MINKFKSLKKLNFYAVILFSIIFLGVTQSSFAQDKLPRDNTIFDYHRTPRYRVSEEHPLRLFAYLTHPIGWALREAITRPLSAFTSSTEVTRSVFGYREAFDFRETECFSSDGAVPDCKQVSPLINIEKYRALTKASSSAEIPNQGGNQNQVYFPDINFDFNKATLNKVGMGKVRQVSQLLSSVPNMSVVVEGHADYIGSDSYNDSLGNRRAETVINELVELGIDSSRLSPISYGEGKPVYTEEEDWARAVNRRVQFSVGSAIAEAVGQ